MRTKLLLLFAICLTAFGVNAQVTSVAIVGQAQGGWPGDNPENPADLDAHQMTTTDGENWTYVGLTLINATPDGGIKFRANNAWAISWGSTAFPSGTGALGGANILCVGGTYDVTFNSTTGVYNFEGPPIPVVKLVGTAVTDINGVAFTTADAENYTATNVTLVDGLGQFDIDGALSGSPDFPAGSATDPLAFIPITAGVYSSITINISTGDFAFVAAPVYPLISITGDAVGGWGDGFDFDMTTTDGITYTYNGLLVSAIDGLKFRTNHDWDQPNYGGGSWPTGNTSGAGNIIPTAAGTYDVTFNLTTGDYSFSFPVISLTGAAFGGWGDGFDFDLTTTDGANYTLTSITAVATDGGKFRSNHSWDAPNLNYGSATFPAGIALATTSDNIPVTAGSYSVDFNRTTGVFNFNVLATKGFSTSNFKVYPNPTNNNWNFSSVKENIQSIQIVDVLGKVVMTVNPNTTAANVDASALNAGMYFAKIATATATQTIKLVKN